MQYTYTEPTLSKKGAQLRDLLVKYLDIFSHRLPDDVTKKLVEYSIPGPCNSSSRSAPSFH